MEKAKLRPKKSTAARYGVSIRTINRWEASETLDFPKAVTINGRDYYPNDELDEFDRRCALRVADEGRLIDGFPENAGSAGGGPAPRRFR